MAAAETDGRGGVGVDEAGAVIGRSVAAAARGLGLLPWRRGGTAALIVALALGGIACSGPTDVVVDLVAERGKGRPVRAVALEDFGAASPSSQLLDGWGSREVELDTMDDFRWATQGRAEVALWIVPGQKHCLTFRAWPFSWPQAPPQTVTVVVNGTSIAKLELANTATTYSIPVTPAALLPGRNVVTFLFSRVDIPHERVPSDRDSRSLAAAFLWLELSPRSYAAAAQRPEGGEARNDLVATKHIVLASGEGFAFSCRLPSRHPRLQLSGLATGVEGLRLGVWVKGERSAPKWFELAKLRTDTRTNVDLSFAAGEKVELVFFAERMSEAPSPSSGGDRDLAVVAELAAPDSEVRAIHSHVVVDFELEDDRLLHRGWAPPEQEVNSAERFAWAVGESAELRLFLLPDPPQWLSLRAWPFSWPEAPPQHFTFFLNEEKVADLDMTPEAATYAWRLPEGSVRAGENSVRFAFSRVGVPHALVKGKPESRPLAAAFAWVEVASQAPPPDALRPRLVASSSVRVTPAGLLLQPGEAALFSVPPNRWIQPRLQFTLLSTSLTRPAVRVWVFGNERPTASETTLCEAKPAGAMCDAAAGTLAGLGGKLVVHAAASAISPAAGDAAMVVAPRLVSSLRPPSWVEIFQAEVVGRGDFATDRKNLLLIVVDTLRADHLGCYGGRARTPTIDRLAERGYRVSHAWAPAPITGPSHAAMFTGLAPRRLQVLNNGQRLPEGVVTLAEILRSRGYTTAGFVSLGVLSGKFGFAQGFDVFDDAFDADWLKDAREVNEGVFAWVRDQRQGPFFLWVHYSDPHEPYAPPDLEYPRLRIVYGGHALGHLEANGRGRRFSLVVPAGGGTLEIALASGSLPYPLLLHQVSVDSPLVTAVPVESCRQEGVKTFLPADLTRRQPMAVLRLGNNTSTPVATSLSLAVTEDLPITEIRARYAREVEYCDQQIGRLLALLEAQGMLQNTAVIFVADHGESLGEHEHVGHISRLYEPALQVPFIVIRGGPTTPSAIVPAWASLVDVLPTALEVVGLPVPADLDGVSVLSLARQARPPRPLFAETFPPESPWHRQAVLWKENKLIRTRNEVGDAVELYRLPEDPLELRDLRVENPEAIAELLRLLAQFENVQSRAAAPRAPRLSGEERARLRSLGYIR